MSEFDVQTDNQELALRSLRGKAAPPGLRDDARALASLPDELREALPELLIPFLSETAAAPPGLEDLCKKHNLDPQSLVPSLRCARFVVMSAARAALDDKAFIADCADIAEPGWQRDLIGVLLPCFQRAAPAIRDQIVAQSLAEHGRAVEKTHWRIDRVVNSEHGDGINTPIAVLTFAFREGERRDRITLSFMPEQLAALKQACSQMLPDD